MVVTHLGDFKWCAQLSIQRSCNLGAIHCIGEGRPVLFKMEQTLIRTLTIFRSFLNPIITMGGRGGSLAGTSLMVKIEC